MEFHEAHVELLLGRRVHDTAGRNLGRLEELHVEIVDGEHVVTEFHIGGSAMFERIASFVTQLPFLRLLPYARTGYCVRWEDVDLSDPRSPRVRVRGDALKRVALSGRQ